MKVIFCLTLLLTSITSFSHDIHTIRDIPWKFDGISGDLFNEQKVSLQITELLGTETIPGDFGTRTNNQVRGLIFIGNEKKIAITRFDIETNGIVKNVYSVFVKINNQFEKTLFLTLKYDLVSDTFKLNEIPSRRHPARFFMEGRK
tara:strand:- start:2822 stop:3259 length:438 start_codon:yes stop_codon:yes gene_type:complete